MPRSQARISTSIWSDDDFRSLTPDAQRMYFLILSEPSLSLCGVVPYSPKRWASFAAGSTPRDVAKAVHTLQDRRYVLVDDKTDELWVRSFIKNDNVLTQPKIIIGMTRALLVVVSTIIADRIWAELGEGFIKGLREGFEKAFKQPFPYGLPEPFVKAFGERYPKGLPEPSVRARVACAPPPASSLHPPSSLAQETLSETHDRPEPDKDDGETREANGNSHPKPHPDQTVLDHIAAAISGTQTDWTHPHRLAQLTTEWDWGTQLLDRRHLEDTLLRCQGARHPNYLHQTILAAAQTAEVAVPETRPTPGPIPDLSGGDSL